MLKLLSILIAGIISDDTSSMTIKQAVQEGRVDIAWHMLCKIYNMMPNTGSLDINELIYDINLLKTRASAETASPTDQLTASSTPGTASAETASPAGQLTASSTPGNASAEIASPADQLTASMSPVRAYTDSSRSPDQISTNMRIGSKTKSISFTDQPAANISPTGSPIKVIQERLKRQGWANDASNIVARDSIEQLQRELSDLQASHTKLREKLSAVQEELIARGWAKDGSDLKSQEDITRLEEIYTTLRNTYVSLQTTHAALQENLQLKGWATDGRDLMSKNDYERFKNCRQSLRTKRRVVRERLKAAGWNEMGEDIVTKSAYDLILFKNKLLIEMSNQSCWTAAHASGLSVTPAEIAASINNMTSIDDWVAQGDDDTVSACYSGVSYSDVTDLQKFTLLMALIRNGKTQDEIDVLNIIFADGEVCAGTIGSPCLGLKII